MTIYCSKCGSAFMDDHAAVCPICGTLRDDMTPEQGATLPATDDTVSATEDTLQTPVRVTKRPFLLGMGAGAAAMLAIIAVVFLLFHLLYGIQYRGALDMYMDFYTTGDIKNVETLVPEDTWETFAQTSGKTVEELQEAVADELDALDLSDLEEEFGDNVKLTYRIKDIEAVEGDDLEMIEDELKQRYGIAKKSLTHAVEIETEFTFKGDDDEESQDIDMIVLKIDGKYYSYALMNGLYYSYGYDSDYPIYY